MKKKTTLYIIYCVFIYIISASVYTIFGAVAIALFAQTHTFHAAAAAAAAPLLQPAQFLISNYSPTVGRSRCVRVRLLEQLVHRPKGNKHKFNYK